MRDATTTEEAKVTVGLDLGDRHTQVCVLDEAGEVIEEARLATKPEALRRRFSGADPLRIVPAVHQVQEAAKLLGLAPLGKI
jgi:predicted NBD/HSP70 family sugar kinase